MAVVDSDAAAARTHFIGHRVDNLRRLRDARLAVSVPARPGLLRDLLGDLNRVLQLALSLGQDLVLEVAFDVRPVQVAVLLVVHVWLVQAAGQFLDEVKAGPIFAVLDVKQALAEAVFVADGSQMIDSFPIDLFRIRLRLHHVAQIFSPLASLIIDLILLDNLDFVVIGLAVVFLPPHDVVLDDAQVVLELVLLLNVDVVDELHLLAHELQLLALERVSHPVLVQLVAPVAVSVQAVLVLGILHVLLVEPLDELAAEHVDIALDRLGFLQLDLPPPERIFHLSQKMIYKTKFILFNNKF